MSEIQPIPETWHSAVDGLSKHSYKSTQLFQVCTPFIINNEKAWHISLVPLLVHIKLITKYQIESFIIHLVFVIVLHLLQTVLSIMSFALKISQKIES